MKRLFLLGIISTYTLFGFSQEKETLPTHFMNSLQELCGKAYKGEIVSSPVPEDFKDKELIMYIMSCDANQVKIPFFVGDDLSRTWIFTQVGEYIELKHDHRQKDGSPDAITMYGGTTTNSGMEGIQFFPADQQTVDLLPTTAGNVWYVTVKDNLYTYNLKRVDKQSSFSVVFDLSKPIQTEKRPW